MIKTQAIENIISNEFIMEPSPAAKKQFHSEGRKILKAVAKELDLAEVKISSNKAGPACPGNILLRSGNLYISLGAHTFDRSNHVLIRKEVNGKIGHNNHVSYSDLSSKNTLGLMKQIIQSVN